MIEKKFVTAKKQEFMIAEYIDSFFGKGKVDNVKIERTPVGEKIIIYTSKPGLVIGQKGENIQYLIQIFKKNFGLEAPQIEIVDISGKIDAKTIADQIALSLERFGSLGFKIIVYRTLERLARTGVLGAEIIMSGKLPSERARSWRFGFGYMQKTGEFARNVDSAKTTAQTIPGTIGIKVSIIPPEAKISDQIKIDKRIFEEAELKEKEEKEKKGMKEEKAEKKPKERKKRKKQEEKKKENGNTKV